MHQNTNHLYIPVIVAIFSLSSCKKYLDAKPIQTQVVPTDVSQLQAIIDGYRVMNVNYPSLQEYVADNYYLTSADWSALPVIDYKDNYIWNSSTSTSSYSNWFSTYNVVYFSNFVLDLLPKVQFVSMSDVNNVQGEALFFRSHAFYNIAQLWCKPYSSENASSPGIPLRLSSSVTDNSIRSTVQQTYDQIIKDLKSATELLPENVPAVTRPNKAAAYGALARTYLSMRDYGNASKYASMALQKNNTLMNYNDLDSTAAAPISSFNTEVIFQSDMSPQIIVIRSKIDSLLYNSYDDNDLRKVIFFKNTGNGSFGFKGSYDGTTSYFTIFNGIATDELLLIRSECSARAGNKDSALADLNYLLEKRWREGTFVPITAIDATEALNKVLAERRKELVFRGLRYTDLRRLNLEGANITLKRILNGTTYTLQPNDPKWTLLIPYDVIKLSGMSQNLH